MSFNEKYEYDNLEKELVDLENERKRLECDIQNTNISIEKMIEVSTRLGVLVNMIDEKELRWLELDEKNNIYE